jgi:6,7-dimethyl-8-ribityllumazine synthase
MQVFSPQQLKQPFNIALVVSRFNIDVTQKLYEGAVERLKELNFSDEQISVAWAPGSVEIPLLAQRLAKTNVYAAIICLGAVIRGDTSHYDYVCQQVSYGCQRVALEHDLPVIFGVLTTEDETQALDRVGGQHGHKGRDAVDAAVEMVSVLRQIE